MKTLIHGQVTALQAQIEKENKGRRTMGENLRNELLEFTQSQKESLTLTLTLTLIELLGFTQSQKESLTLTLTLTLTLIELLGFTQSQKESFLPSNPCNSTYRNPNFDLKDALRQVSEGNRNYEKEILGIEKSASKLTEGLAKHRTDWEEDLRRVHTHVEDELRRMHHRMGEWEARLSAESKMINASIALDTDNAGRRTEDAAIHAAHEAVAPLLGP